MKTSCYIISYDNGHGKKYGINNHLHGEGTITKLKSLSENQRLIALISEFD